MTPAKLLVILVFSLVVRGAINVAGAHLFADFNNYVDMVSQIIFCGLIFFICVKEFDLRREALAKIFGQSTPSELLWAAMLGVILLMFTFGEAAIQTIVLSHYDVNFAYRWGNFHEQVYPSRNFFSAHVGAFLVASVFIPAFIEEFFFRGLLVRAFGARRSLLRSTLITSAIFTALHPSNGIYVSCFAFAMAACFLYARTASLYPCIIMHATFNLLAFISQHYFDIHHTRSINQLSALTNWVPQIAMLMVSLMVMTWWTLRYRKSIFQSPAITSPLQTNR